VAVINAINVTVLDTLQGIVKRTRIGATGVAKSATLHATVADRIHLRSVIRVRVWDTSLETVPTRRRIIPDRFQPIVTIATKRVIWPETVRTAVEEKRVTFAGSKVILAANVLKPEN
jgi:hypothetical protein